MERVLLAIDGITPSRRVFGYAVQLCQRLKAELSVLQVLSPDQYREYLDRVRQKTRQAKRFIEGSMVAATFAEAGEHATAAEMMALARKNLNELLPESKRKGVPFDLTVRSGHLSKEIIRYLNEHRNVVLAIYDKAQEENQAREDPTRVGGVVHGAISGQLSIPLVVVRR